jgi:glutamate-ammonia-ligase adenylyltransferase
MAKLELNAQILPLAQKRLGELQAKWPSLTASESGLITLNYLLGMSDFIYQSCLRYQKLSELFFNLHSNDVLLSPYPMLGEDALALDENSFLRAIREHRHSVMSVIAARDFLSLQPIEDTMFQLSELADEYYVLCREWAKLQLKPRWGQAFDGNGEEVELIALGMGKLGGMELNFSSDIDLIFCYAEKGQTSGGRKQEDFQTYFTKLAQKIIQLLDNVTPDGRVFRVDMRLRPFGDSGPLVSNFDAIEDYYQDQGRDWERYALLKARPLGCNLIKSHELAQQALLMQTLKPFVYRRYIDFSVIDSLRKMKSMIQQEVKRRNLTLNIKLGEGGIREAEFIVQALQMLRGGKAAELQQPSLLKSLPVLATLNVFSEAEAQQLKNSYLWLRKCEQYLQAFADEQTQTLPDDDVNKARLIQLFSVNNWQAFISQYQMICSEIHQLFLDVIGEAPDVSQADSTDMQEWQVLWELTCCEDELNDYQAQLLPLVKDKKLELQKAVSGARGQEKLDGLMPAILSELEQQNVAVDKAEDLFLLVKTIASRTTYLELLLENPGARTQLVKLVTSCHFIGQQLTRFPLLLDLLIDPKLLYSPVEVDSYYSELRRHLLRVEPDDLELQMEVLRQFKLSSQLAIAACDVEGVLNLMQVSDHLTSLAEACLQHAVDIAWHHMVARYGYPVGADAENKNFAVIGYGKLGGFELGYGSDLDIVFVHGCETSAATSGAKAIDSRQFYIKLVQRVMHIFTTRTLSGELYELDTRLRPSGASGLLAINIETFAEYQREEAWTWEHQALVRSRFILGEDKLAARFSEIRNEILSSPREKPQLQKDISEMRSKMFTALAKEDESLFDLKQSRGGIADIEFISQYLVLLNAREQTELLTYPDNIRILEAALATNLLSEAQVSTLVQGYIDYRARYHIASLNGDNKQALRSEVSSSAEGVTQVWQQVGLN